MNAANTIMDIFLQPGDAFFGARYAHSHGARFMLEVWNGQVWVKQLVPMRFDDGRSALSCAA